MEVMAILAVIGFIVLLMVGAIMGLTSHSRIGRLERQIKLLRREVASLGTENPNTQKPNLANPKREKLNLP